MNDRDRLIELLDGFVFGTQIAVNSVEWDSTKVKELTDHLLANGVIVPPCKVGDTVYIVDGTTDGIVVGTITRLEQNIYTTPSEWITIEGNYPFFGQLESKNRVDLLLGKTVFLTKDEAEEALKERGEGK